MRLSALIGGWRVALAGVGVLVLAACQPALDEAEVARVNHESITRRDLEAERQLWPDEPEGQTLQRVIDRRLAAQKAVMLGLHRDPMVQERLEAQRVELWSQALKARLESEVPALAPGAVQAYYDAHPTLYAERRLFNVRHLLIEVAPERAAAVRTRVMAARHLPELVNWLRSERLQVEVQQSVGPSQEFPAPALLALASMKEGEVRVDATPDGLEVWWLVSSRPQPYSLERARPEIEAHLIEEWRQARWQQELAQLRSQARVIRMPSVSSAAGSSGAASGGAGVLPQSQPAVHETH